MSTRRLGKEQGLGEKAGAFILIQHFAKKGGLDAEISFHLIHDLFPFNKTFLDAHLNNTLKDPSKNFFSKTVSDSSQA